MGKGEIVFTGSERAKGRFTATALRTARRHAKLVVAGHPFLAPVVQAMRIAAPRMKSLVCAHGVEVWEPLRGMRRSALRRSSLIITPTENTANYVATAAGHSAGTCTGAAVGARSGF